MKQQTSSAIVLRRTNYGEADRIITFLTPIGKVRAMVKGVRRSKSKLAGGIELFSESTITFLQTQGDLQRIISTRLEQHWDGIVGDLQRMMFGYEAMKLMDQIIEDEADTDYYNLLKATLKALNDVNLPLQIIEVWFYVRLLGLQGHMPNLETDHTGERLKVDTLYAFSLDDMCFIASSRGEYRPEHIKFLRLTSTHTPQFLGNVQQSSELAKALLPLTKQLIHTHNR